MRAGTLALMAVMAGASATPAVAQIADRVGQGRERGTNAVVVRPEAADRAVGGRGRGGVVVVPDRVRCRDGDRDRRDGRRDGRHDWFGDGVRYDCEREYGREGRRFGVAIRASLAREHTVVLAQLDREHERWHRAHGWYPRNRGWQRSHESLHRRLERDHERWHGRAGVPFILRGDREWHDDLPGRGRGVVVIR